MHKIFTASLVANITSVALLLASFIFVYVTFVPVDVLRNWRVSVPQDVYRLGENAVIYSEYEKLRSVSGTAHRFLECLNTNGAYTRYHISQGDANRPVGKGKASIVLRIPDEVPNIPTKCRIVIAIDYTVYSFRKVTEHAQTNEFTLTE